MQPNPFNWCYHCDRLKMAMKKGKGTGIFKALGMSSKLIGIHVHDRFLEAGIQLTRPQYVLLKVLSDEDGRCQNDLAFLTERDKTSMARLVTSLEKKGFVSRRTDKFDHRKNRIFLTKAGHNILGIAEPVMAEIEYNLTIDLDPKDIQTTLSTISKIQSKVFGTASVQL